VIDGRSARSCLTLAVQVDGAVVETIEGLTASGAIADLQSEFVRRNALQCGYCTPGVLVTAAELLTRGRATRTEIRDALSGNYCRCTGYHAIVDAIEAVIGRRRGAEP
jgi:aerobic carbon-monoxide dehydrogenase small subunit